jgi:hypothetical protein
MKEIIMDMAGACLVEKGKIPSAILEWCLNEQYHHFFYKNKKDGLHRNRLSLLFILFVLSLIGTRAFAQESDNGTTVPDLATQSGNNPIVAQTRIDVGYSYSAFDSAYSAMYHDFRVSFNYAINSKFQLGMEVPLIGFSAPNPLLSETKVTTGDFKIKSLYVPFVSPVAQLGGGNSVNWGVASGLDVTLPTGKKEYGTGANKFLFDPFAAVGAIFTTEKAGNLVLAGMVRYGGSIGIDEKNMLDNYLISRLIFTQVLPTGTFYTLQFNYVSDFLAVSHNQNYRQQVYARVILGQMFSRKMGMSLEFTQHIAGDYLAAPFNILQVMFRYIL